MLVRRLSLRFFCKDKSLDNIQINKQGRMFFDIPKGYSGSKFQYNINEDVPKDAQPFPLDGISIVNQKDNPDFDKIPKLYHGLNKLLDGKIYKGDMGFGKFPTVSKEILSQLQNYKPPSKDETLLKITEQAKCKYSSSTSSISIPLIHLYFVFSMFRRPCFENIYEGAQQSETKREYMAFIKKPVSFFVTKKTNLIGRPIYTIDADNGFSEEKTNEVLLQLGNLAEYWLTHSPQALKKILETGVVQEKLDNYHRYCIVNNNILLRSQIDCRDIDQNGNPYVFQIKTRASCPIRYDVQNWQLYKDYPIDKLRGNYQSFQREYFDLIRGAFIKYAFQLKIGKMDGAFVAYHNTEQIYGYEYVNFKEIVMRLFGDEHNLQISFGIISKMLTSILDYVLQDTKAYSYEQLKVGFFANSVTKSLNVIVQVMSEVKEYPVTLGRSNMEQFFNKQVKELKNPVFKYDFSFYTFLNGILVRYPEIYYSPSDNLKMQWKVKKFGRIQKEEYILFLRQAYKEEFVFGNSRYYGYWQDIPQIKEWN